MPITQAAMDGINANGHRWQHRITLAPYTAMLGKLNDRNGDGDTPTREEIEPVVENIVAKVRSFAEARLRRDDNDQIGRDLASRADDLECVSDCEIEEVNHAMNELYDSFDFWRVLVN